MGEVDNQKEIDVHLSKEVSFFSSLLLSKKFSIWDAWSAWEVAIIVTRKKGLPPQLTTHNSQFTYNFFK